MAVNVTQKDQTLNEIIDFCEEVKSVWCRLEGAHARGYREALAEVIAHCRDRLGYSGVMPLEVPNQSEGADHRGNDGGSMKDLHIWRWDGVEEAVEEATELPEEPTVAGWYVTATSDQVLYNDGDACANWSRPHGAKWSTGNTYEDWVVVAHDLGPERLPLKPILKKED